MLEKKTKISLLRSIYPKNLAAILILDEVQNYFLRFSCLYGGFVLELQGRLQGLRCLHTRLTAL